MGEYKNAVFARYGLDPTTCLTSADGEVEDYKLVVSASSTYAWTSDVGAFAGSAQETYPELEQPRNNNIYSY